MVSTGWSNIIHCTAISEICVKIFQLLRDLKIRYVPWPLRSQDLSVCDSFLWGYLKSKVYMTRPRTLDELKQRIQDEVHSILTEMLQQSMRNLNSRF